MSKQIEEWQKGNESTLGSIEKVYYHSEWLKEQHADIKEKIKVKPVPILTEKELEKEKM